MRFLSVAKIAAALAAVVTVLAACVVVEEGPGYGPGPRPGPGPGPICTREYAPVCGVRGGDRQTFGNECLARADGYRVVREGECRRGGGGGGGGGGRPPQACTFEYAPVCAVRGGERQTFGNECQARADGYRVISRGECRRGGGGGNRPPQSCTREYDPVCARRGRDLRTFGNACEARAAEYRVEYRGRC